jgi:hypothetical protein
MSSELFENQNLSVPPATDPVEMIAVDQIEAHPAADRHIPRALVAAVCAGSFVLAAAYSGEANPDADTIPPSAATLQLPAYNLSECPRVPLNILNDVDKLISKPAAPEVYANPNNQNQTYEVSSDLFQSPKLTERQQLKADMATRLAVAAETGVTIYDPTIVTDRLVAPLESKNEEFYVKSDISFDEYLKAADEFANRYGVTIRLADEGDTSNENLGFYPFTASSETDTAKKALINAIDGLGSFPVEYIKMSGVKEVVLYKDQDARWGGLAMYEERQIALPVGGDFTPGRLTMAHEIGHHIADKVCGGASTNDPQFSQIGNDKISNSDTPANATVLYDERSTAMKRKDTLHMCALTEEINEFGQNAGAFSDYGKTNISENKAEGAMTLGTHAMYQNNLRPGAPPRLRERAELILGHIDMASPNVARYFVRIMPRNITQDRVTTACQDGDFSDIYNASTDN